MGKLSDILANADGDTLRQAWKDTEAADDFTPLPPGEYVAHIIRGDLEQSRSNATPGYKLTFKVLEPAEHKDRQFWHDIWLTPAALPMAKRDLGKLGVVSLDQLEQPLPRFIRCQVKLALRKDDDGNEYNRVRRFDALGIDQPEADAFAPDDGDNAPDSAGDEIDDDAEAELSADDATPF